LKTISGLLRPESGSIILNGVDITEAPPHKIVEMGISHVPEGRGIFSNLTVEENLTLATWVPKKNKTTRREDYDRVYSIFPRLLERRRQPGGTPSPGGEQQMLRSGAPS
jgi:branched-chain amino acid transport system ATP-binding protein